MRPERNCSRCGKNFIPAPYHIYVDGESCYCSWTCYNHRKDKTQKPKKESRKVEQYSKDWKLMRVFESAKKAQEQIESTVNGIRCACRNRTLYKGCYWKYGS
jgi:hypothetical protein